MTDALLDDLRQRAEGRCELCEGTDALEAVGVPPHAAADADHSALLCGACRAQLDAATLDPNHWYCLQGAAWSEHAPVVVLSWRLLGRLTDQPWALELRDQLYLDDETLAWAKNDGTEVAGPPTLDCNGVSLANGDTVVVIKDLNVKGSSLVAKRGTAVRNIRLSDDPELIEGRVEKQAVMLKTCFVKKSG